MPCSCLPVRNGPTPCRPGGDRLGPRALHNRAPRQGAGRYCEPRHLPMTLHAGTINHQRATIPYVGGTIPQTRASVPADVRCGVVRHRLDHSCRPASPAARQRRTLVGGGPGNALGGHVRDRPPGTDTIEVCCPAGLPKSACFQGTPPRGGPPWRHLRRMGEADHAPVRSLGAGDP